MASSSVASFKVRASTTAGRKWEVANFAGRVPALEDPKAAVHLGADEGAISEYDRTVRGRSAPQLLHAGGKRYDGAREAVGTNAESDTCYVVAKLDEATGIVTFAPLAEWHKFRPAVTHATIGLEDAEELMARASQRARLADEKMRKLREEELHEDEKAAAAEAAKNGGRAGRPAAAAKPEADDDDFDDGAGPAWAARDMADEDGNEGLDMEDEDLFEDDEDDGLADDDHIAANHRKYIREDKAVLADAARARHDDEGDDEGDDDGDALAAQLASSDDDDEGARPRTTEAYRRLRADLRAERALRRKEEGLESSDEEDEDDDEGAAAMPRHLLGTGRSPVKAEDGAPAGDKRARSPSAAGGDKRARSPSGGPESAAKRAKQTAATVASAGTHMVEERDVVMLLHQRGQMTVKELYAHFKDILKQAADRPAARRAFIDLVERVCHKVDQQSQNKAARLNQATLVKYNLEEQ